MVNIQQISQPLHGIAKTNKPPNELATKHIQRVLKTINTLKTDATTTKIAKI